MIKNLFNNLGSRLRLKHVLLILSLFVIAVLFIAPEKNANTSTSPTVNTTQPTSNESSAFKLASLEVGYNSPSQYAVSNFQTLLDGLKDKCSNETEDQIANYIFKGKEMIENKGGSITLMEFGEGMNESIPEEYAGVISCAEIAAALVALTI